MDAAHTAHLIANLTPSSFDSSHLIISPSSLATPPTDTVKHYLHSLASAAHQDASQIACSSILAGATSESDDTADIALWLGTGDCSTPSLVLSALGLSEWAASGEVKSYSIPRGPQIDGLLGELHDTFSFRANSQISSSTVLFFLVGRVSSGGWAGLVGIGTWS